LQTKKVAIWKYLSIQFLDQNFCCVDVLLFDGNLCTM